MKKIYLSALTLCTVLGVSAQNILWQKDIQSSTQDFLSQVTTTIDQQYLITGSSIQSGSGKLEAGSKPNNGYDFHLVKLNQQGEEAWEKYFSGNNHDYLSATVSTQDGGFLLAGTSYSGKGLDKKEDSKGGSDIWLIRINEFGDEIWQKTLGTSSDEEAKAVIQSTDLGFFVAGNVQSSSKGYGSKDVWIIRLDKDGKELSQLVLGGKGLDEVEKMIPTKTAELSWEFIQEVLRFVIRDSEINLMKPPRILHLAPQNPQKTSVKATIGSLNWIKPEK
ncbi:hypothetical protein QWZ06_15585 [Chryseobacterium tructae]|nr:hypothetical protein [Chryseobacterium tructae]MDN3693607.1 hypothetical protein [Chryseobacterium tructae]